MQSLGRRLNPECEHVLGDMRTLRLERTFDTVLVHIEGLFTRAVWLEVLRGVGFTAEAAVRPLEGGGTQAYFLARRP